MHGMRWCVCLIVFALTALAGCKRESGAPGVDGPIKLQLNWKPEPQFGGFYAAREGGVFRKRGLDVEIVSGGVGTPTVQMVGTGKVDFAVVSADELVIARERGNPVVALFAAYQTCPQGIMTHASRGFRDIGDVFRSEGVVAMQQGLPYAEFLRRRYGFEKVKVAPSPGGDLSLFLRDPNYAMQCFVTSEPIAARRLGADPQTFLVADAGYNPYTTVLVTRDEFLQAHPDTVRAVVAACREGWQAYLDDPGPTNAVMGNLNPSMEAETFVASAKAQEPLIRTGETKIHGLGHMTRERWETLGRQLVELGVISKAPPPEQCFVAVEPPATVQATTPASTR